MLDVNLSGVVNGLVSFVPHLKAHGEGGHVVNTASMAGLIVGPGMGLYSASKFAVVGLTASLRYDLAPHGIGVSMLCPGFVRSNIHEAVLARPERYLHSGYTVGADDMKRLDQVLSVGMDPLDVGRAVLAGIGRNDLYIFPHAEFRDELRGIFDEILAALPDRAPDPARMAMEDGRRSRHRRLRVPHLPGLRDQPAPVRARSPPPAARGADRGLGADVAARARVDRARRPAHGGHLDAPRRARVEARPGREGGAFGARADPRDGAHAPAAVEQETRGGAGWLGRPCTR